MTDFETRVLTELSVLRAQMDTVVGACSQGGWLHWKTRCMHTSSTCSGLAGLPRHSEWCLQSSTLRSMPGSIDFSR